MKYYFSVLNLYNRFWYYIKGRDENELLEIEKENYREFQQGEYSYLDEETWKEIRKKLKRIVNNEFSKFNIEEVKLDSWPSKILKIIYGPENVSYKELIDDGFIFKIARVYREKDRIVFALSFDDENF